MQSSLNCPELQNVSIDGKVLVSPHLINMIANKLVFNANVESDVMFMYGLGIRNEIIARAVRVKMVFVRLTIF